jgi:hypothetical protein
MERKKVIDNLSNATKVISKIIRSNSLPADLEIEATNLRYDLLALLDSINMESCEMECQCP